MGSRESTSRVESTPKSRSRKRNGSISSVTSYEGTVDERLEAYCSKVRDILLRVKNENYSLLQRIIDKKDPYFKKLYTIYEQMTAFGYTQDFHGEFALRLYPMLKSQGNQKAEAARVLTFAVNFAIRALNERKNADIIGSLTDMCCQWASAREVIIRHNCCATVGYFFRHYPDIFSDAEEIGKDAAEIREKLYSLLIKFSTDTSYLVRNQCCVAMEAVQDVETSNTFVSACKHSPKDCILRALQDRVALVRQTAVKCTSTVNGPFYAKELVVITTEESNTQVRKEAITKLSTVWPLHISIEDRQALLFNNLSIDSNMTEFLKKKLIAVWLTKVAEKIVKNEEMTEKQPQKQITKGLSGAIMHIFEEFDWDKHESEVYMILSAVFDVVRRIINTERGVGLPEMIRLMVDDDTKSYLISRYNREELLLGLAEPKQVACNAFFWRSLIQYCHEQTDVTRRADLNQTFEADRSSCLLKLAPCLAEMCEFTAKLGKTVTDYKDVDHQKFTRRATIECLKICSFLDRDPTGMNLWQEMLETCVFDPTTNDDDLSYLSTTLMENFYRGNQETLLSHLLNRLSDMQHHELNPNDTEIILHDESDHLFKSERKPKKKSLEGTNLNMESDEPIQDIFKRIEDEWSTPPQSPGKRDRSLTPEPSNEFTLQHIRIVNAVLKTGVFTEFNPYLQEINDIPRCLGSQDEVMTTYALSVSTMLALIDHTMLEGALTMLFTTAKEYTFQATPRMFALKAIVDLAMFYEEETREWMECQDEEEHFYTLFNDCLLNDSCSEEALISAVEQCSKLILFLTKNKTDEEYIALTASLIARAVHPSIEGMPKVKSCILQCFSALKILGRQKIRIMSNALLFLLNDMYNHPEKDFYEVVKIERAAIGVIEITRCFGTDKDNQASLHAEYLEAVLEMLYHIGSETRFTKIYCGIIAEMDIDVPLNLLGRYIRRTQECLTKLREENDTADQTAELEKLLKQLTKLQAKQEEAKENEDKLGELPMSTVLRKRPPKRPKNLITPLLATPDTNIQAEPRRARIPRSAKAELTPGVYMD